MALCPGLPGWAGTRKATPIWILLKQETVSGSGISWAVCKSAPHSTQTTMPTPHHSVFYKPDALPAAQPTASKHWRQLFTYLLTGSKRAQSEMVMLRLFKSYCLTFVLYATEVMQLSKNSLKLLIFCMAKIFNTYDRDCINQIRLACDLPGVSMIIERRRMKFMNNLLENEHLHYLGLHDWWWWNGNVISK